MGADKLTFTLRLHDPAEKKDPKKSTAWIVADVERADLALPLDEFCERYAKPMIKQGLAQLFRPVPPATDQSASPSQSQPAPAGACMDLPTAAATAPETPTPSAAAPGDIAPSIQDPAATDGSTGDPSTSPTDTPDPKGQAPAPTT
jgi:hypothetical protein